MTACRSGRAYYPVYTTLISGANIPANQGYRPKIDPCIIEAINKSIKSFTNIETVRNEVTQTLFRESETQTDPFRSDVAEPTEPGLEILTLGWLSWNNGLPAGIREALAIERARQRRAWENALPVPVDRHAIDIRKSIIEAIELNEWNYREVQLAALSSVRLEFAKKCSKENLASIRVKFENRMLRYVTTKTEEKDLAIKKMRWELSRKLRKMIYSKNNPNRKYKKWDVVKEFSDATSEWYGPQEKFGWNPRRYHEEIPPELRYWNTFTHADILKQQMKLFDMQPPVKFDFESQSKPVKDNKVLCVKETNWTEDYLHKLFLLLKSFRRHRARSMSIQPLKYKHFIKRSESLSEMPRVVADSEDDVLYQACLYLQKTVKGRAIQMVMFEGRVRCQELIEELKSTHALQTTFDSTSSVIRDRIYVQQRSQEVKMLEEKRRKEIFAALEGKTISDVLDFLAKELARLQNERDTHALALMADRERHRREAEEAGRRQAEEQRRREHEEMWKQIVKIYQNSVDIIHEGYADEVVEKVASKYARIKAEEYAKKIDRAAQEAVTNASVIAMEEIVADLVHNFALPEVEKRIVRKRLADRQRVLLSACHNEIYSNIENLARGPRTPSGMLKPIMRPQKHRVPSMKYIKFLKLKRLSTSGSISEETSLEESEKSEVFDIWSTGYSPGDVLLEGDRLIV